MSKYKVGDVIKIRTWEDMEQDFGLRPSGDIKTRLLFLKEMKKYCGKHLEISYAHKDGVYEVNAIFHKFSDDMIQGKDNSFGNSPG